jgi:DNA-directed RNA polymerase subunit RPC12/RpoP
MEQMSLSCTACHTTWTGIFYTDESYRCPECGKLIYIPGLKPETEDNPNEIREKK